MRYLSLVVILLCSCIAHSGAEPSDDFSVKINQGGRVITPINGTYTLDKSTFDVVAEFSNSVKILVNAHTTDTTYKQALQGKSISELTGFETTAMAGHPYNKGLTLQIAEKSPGYWHYENLNNNHCNRISLTNGTLSCTRTVANIYDADTNTAKPVSQFEKESLYLVLISFERGKSYSDRIEKARKLVKIQFTPPEFRTSDKPEILNEEKATGSEQRLFFGFYGQLLKISSEKSEEQGISSVTQGLGIFGGKELIMTDSTSLMFNFGGGLAFAEDRGKFSEFVTYDGSYAGDSKSSSIRGLAFNMEIDARYQLGPRVSLFAGAGIEKLKLRRQIESCYGCSSENIDLDSAAYLSFGIMDDPGNVDRHFRIGYKLIRDDAYGHVINIGLMRIFP